MLAFFLQRIADAALIWFTFLPSEPNAVSLRGAAIGSLLWTSTLLIGVWRRLRWARYLLTTFTWLHLVGISFYALIQWDRLRQNFIGPHLALIVVVIFYLGANIILIRSSRVRHYANV